MGRSGTWFGWFLWALFAVCVFFATPWFMVDLFLADHGMSREQNIESHFLFLGWFNSIYSETTSASIQFLGLVALVGQWVTTLVALAKGQMRYVLYGSTAVLAALWGGYGSYGILADASSPFDPAEAAARAYVALCVTFTPLAIYAVRRKFRRPVKR